MMKINSKWGDKSSDCCTEAFLINEIKSFIIIFENFSIDSSFIVSMLFIKLLFFMVWESTCLFFL